MKHFITLFALLVTSLAFGQESCPNLFDSNSNGAVDIEDFLAVLSLFSDVDSDSDGIWDSQDDCIDLEACNYAASPSEPCAFIDVLGECGGGCEGDGDGDGICDDEDDCVGVVDECGVCNGPGPTEVVIEDITILYDSVFLPIDNEWFVYAVEVDTTFGYTCVLPIEGCMDSSACNYDELANTDDGSCDYISCLGCTDSSACNFDASATYDDGTCSYSGCVVIGCTVPIACNYNPNANANDGSCDFLSCAGCTDPLACNYEETNALNDGSCEYESCAPSFEACGDPVSYQGYDYATVLIGDQCWFAENLRSENYENGDVISSGLSDWEWENTSVGAVALYDETYGLLYNSDAMFDARGLCPSGWHVPSDGEWMTMEMALGMSESEANDNGLRGTDEGSQMKADYGWSNGGNGTNSSGFSGLPGGFRTDFGNYVGAGNSGYWWSSSGGWPWYRNLSSYDEGVSRWSCNPKVGFSIRCLQDSE
jgi:uncharacterized protein (TIGR02145 family)